MSQDIVTAPSVNILCTDIDYVTIQKLGLQVLLTYMDRNTTTTCG